MIITKSNIEVYKIRKTSFGGWADITIDEGKNSGRISIASDFGSWQNYWGACGSSFKSFLAEINIDYAAGKFRASNHFDTDESVKLLKEKILYYRKTETLDRERARVIFNEAESLLSCGSEGEFIHVISSCCGELMKFFEYAPELSYNNIDPGFARFWKMVWPIFLDYIKNEKVEDVNPN